MIDLDSYPFDKLRLPAGERVAWQGHNPTFHRGCDYGILLTDVALYLYSPFWLWFSRWRRIPVHSIKRATFQDSRFSPSLRIEVPSGRETLRTPLDYCDEMDYDRRILSDAAARVSAMLRPVLE